MSMPLSHNRNHQETAFAGSLNALCTIVGWGTMFLLLGELGMGGNVVIHRSTIRYRRPVQATTIIAQALPLQADSIDYFLEMLEEKGTSKLDICVEIAGDDSSEKAPQATPLVSFKGAYVVK